MTTRRSFLKTGGAAATASLLGAPSSVLAGQKRNKKIKNILFILTDQQRQDCLGAYGNKIVQTPNIDKLMANGCQFNQAYTPTAVCCPARTTIQSGLLSYQHGQYKNSEWSYNDTQELDPSIPLFPQKLKEQGWNQAHVGKWHVGIETKPSDYGYEGEFYPGYGYPSHHDHYQAYLSSKGQNGFKLLEEKRDPTNYRIYYGLQDGNEECSIPGYVTNMAMDKIRKFAKSDKPFFVSANYWGPHAPYIITKKYYNYYKKALIEAWPNWDANLDDKPEIIRQYGHYWKTGWFNKEAIIDLMAHYYSYITLIDEWIGKLVDTLKEEGVYDETLIVFSTDHGGSIGAYQMWDKGFGMYDCLYRIPMIFSHPSFKARQSDAFVSLTDLCNTFLDVAGLDPMEKSIGRSLLPIARGEKDTVREDFMVCQAYGHQMPFYQRMIRTKDAKYIYNPTSKDEYYDMANDPWEMKNIADKVSQKDLKEMKDKLFDFMQKTNDPIRIWSESTMAYPDLYNQRKTLWK